MIEGGKNSTLIRVIHTNAKMQPSFNLLNPQTLLGSHFNFNCTCCNTTLFWFFNSMLVCTQPQILIYKLDLLPIWQWQIVVLFVFFNHGISYDCVEFMMFIMCQSQGLTNCRNVCHQTTTNGMKVGNENVNTCPVYLGPQDFLHRIRVVKDHKSKVGQLPTNALGVDP